MAYTLHLFDRDGRELNEGDFVKISDGSRIQFYAEVKYLDKENSIAPFHTFSFHSMIKVDKLPEGLVKADEERYEVWHNAEPDDDETVNSASVKQYLMDWRACEHSLHERMFRISKL